MKKESSKIAKNIVREREKSPIISVQKLVEIIQKSKKKKFQKENKYFNSSLSSNKNFCK